MARFFKLVVYTTGGEYETKEILIDEITFRQCQQALMKGNDTIILEDRVIRKNMIKEIVPADDIVAEYVRSGVKVEDLGLISGKGNFKLNPGEVEWKNPLLEDGQA